MVEQLSGVEQISKVTKQLASHSECRGLSKYIVVYLGLFLDKGNFQFIQFCFIFLERESC